MKKILLYLLLACSISTFAQAEFPEGIQLGGNTSTANSTKLLNQNPTTGTLDHINATSLPVSTATANALDLKVENSAGAIEGFAITNNGDGTVNIATGTAYLRTTNNPYSPLIKYVIPAVTNLALMDNANNFVLVDYNGGSPALTVTIAPGTINTTTNSIAYLISRVGTTLDYINLVGQNVDANGKLRRRFLNSESLRRASGVVLTASNRNLLLTAGLFYSGLIEATTPAFNTATGSTFTQAYLNGSTWVRTTGNTQINNTQYSLSGVLTAMPSNDYRVDYVYALADNPSKLYVLLGTTTYNNITNARLAPVPVDLPTELQYLGARVGRVIIQKDATTTETTSEFATIYQAGTAQLHNDLGGLNLGEFQHLTVAEKADLVHKTGNETINGVKSFNDKIVVNGVNWSVSRTSSNLQFLTQGYSYDGTFNYLAGTSPPKIVKYDTNWNIILENTDPFAGISGVNHIGDIVTLGGFIYAPVENSPAVTGMKIAKYNASTLAFVEAYDISAQNHEVSALTTDGTFLYISSFNDSSKIWKYSLTGSFIGVINISNPTPVGIQGLEYYLGDFYVVTETELYKVNLAGSTTTFLRTIPGDLTDDHRGGALGMSGAELGILIRNLTPTFYSNVYFVLETPPLAGAINMDKYGVLNSTAIINPTAIKTNALLAGGGTLLDPVGGKGTINYFSKYREGGRDIGIGRMNEQGSNIMNIFVATGLTNTVNLFSGSTNAQMFFRNSDNQYGILINDGVNSNTRFRILGGAGDIEMLGNGTGNVRIGSASNSGGYKLYINGSLGTNSLNIITSPTTSVGTFELLARNTVAGADLGKIEKVSSGYYATTASPTFTGNPTAPTPTLGDNDTSVATTAFVQSTLSTTIAQTITNGVTTSAPSQDAVFDALALKANLSGADFTGNVGSTSFISGGSFITGTTGKGLEAPNNGSITFVCNNPATPGWTANTNIAATFYKTTVYTVATLPTTGVTTGTYATVSDATAPTYLGALTGGGSVVCPVFYDGTVWRSAIDSNSVSLTGNQTINGNKTFVNDVSINGVKVGKGGGNISSNTVLGNSAGSGNTTGSNNLFLGQNAGLYNGGGFANTSSANSIFIGNNTGNGIGEVNQIVIGDSVQGKGDNTTTIGNPSVVTTYLYGNVETNVGFKKTGGTASQFLKADGSVDGSDVVKNIAKEASQGANVTGTVSETILYSKLIPANTFKDGDFMEVFSRVARPNPNTSSLGVNLRLRVNTTNTLVGALPLAVSSMSGGAAGNTIGVLHRIYNVVNNTLIGSNNGVSLQSDFQNSNGAIITTNFNPTIDNYIFVTGLTFSASDTMYHLGTKITN